MHPTLGGTSACLSQATAEHVLMPKWMTPTPVMNDDVRVVNNTF